jgi:serine protease Do
MKKHIAQRIASWVALCAAVSTAHSQTTGSPSGLPLIDQFSNSVHALAVRVSSSVVQIQVTRYGARNESVRGRTSVAVSRLQSVGSGVIVGADGYIMTNAHVIEGAERIRVSMNTEPAQSPLGVAAQSYAATKDARIIGVFKEADLALIKVDATGLPVLHFANYGQLRQGQLVFAFGSPQGLKNSVSMGLVSSVARQLEPDSALMYVQTDAPINPGNSGGPLVNGAGEIVGLDTFILSQSGGSEGIGFAIPSDLLSFTYDELRQHGHVHRFLIGVAVQTISTALTAALKLQRESGVIVTDIEPGSPAELAGMHLQDILLAVDGRRIDSVPAY